MVRNEEKYQQALQFRTRGFTLEEIAKICEVSKSTVSKWLKNNAISEEVTKRNKHRAGQENAKRLKLINKSRGRERTKQYKEIERAAATEFKHYKTNPLFVAGLMLYMSEGDMKHESQIRISSAKKAVHKHFIRFATEYLGVDKRKIRFWILMYPTHSEETCMKKWKQATSIPFQQFHKNQVIQSAKMSKALHDGIGNTIIGSTVLKRKLIHWITLMNKELS